MKSRYQIYSQMSWLNKEMEENEKNKETPPETILYYETLRLIQTAQDHHLISDEMYSALNSWRQRNSNSAAYGYYTANIHYDLFYCSAEEKEALEDRILHFFRQTDPDILKSQSWFYANFIFNFAMMIRRFSTQDDNPNDIKEFIRKKGSAKENQILRKYLKITAEKPLS